MKNEGLTLAHEAARAGNIPNANVFPNMRFRGNRENKIVIFNNNCLILIKLIFYMSIIS
jgi:hypothetical protein